MSDQTQPADDRAKPAEGRRQPGEGRVPPAEGRRRAAESAPGQSLVPWRKPGQSLVPFVPLDSGRRTWREYLAPALVILLGVLAVVAFGLVVRGRAEDRPGRADSTPVLGGDVEPTAAQVPIPLPSPSPSLSLAPVDSITIERTTVESEINLSAEGVTDWVHWGELGRYSLERDADGGFAILEGTPNPSRLRHTLSPERFSWTGGAPQARGTDLTSGVRTCGADNGFTLSAPAGTGFSTLRLYVGVADARGRLEIRLTTGGKAVRDLWESRGDDFATAAYTIHYSASGTGKISIKWITDASFDDDCGGVALQAATLS